MTSENLFPELLKENRKRRLWPLALSILAAIFSLPVFAILMMEHWSERLSYGGTTLQDIRSSFYNSVAGVGNIPVFMSAMGLAVILGINSMAYLHSKGKTDLYGSLPVRRTQLFAAAYLNGLLFFVLPFFAAQAVTLILGYVRGMYLPSYLPETLLSSVYVMIFYFSVYTLCCLAAVLSGNTLVSVALSCVMLFIAPLGYAAYSGYACVFFRNYYGDSEKMLWRYLSPVLTYVWVCIENAVSEVSESGKTGIEFSGKAITGVSVMLIAGIAVLLWLFVLIRKRPAESAGQALSFKWVRPVLKIVLMVVGTLLISVTFYEISPSRNIGWLIFGFIAGSVLIHAVTEIVCEFDFRACLKHPLSFVTGAVISALLILSFMFDVFGYDSYIPDISAVESEALSGYDFQPTITYIDPEGRGYYIGSEEYRLEKMKLKCAEDVNILAKKGVEFSSRAHKNTLKSHMRDEYPADEDSAYNRIVVRFRLKNGGSVYRAYYIDMNDPEVFDAYARIYETMEYKDGVYPVLKAKASDLSTIRLYDERSSKLLRLDEKEREKLLRVYRQDMYEFEGKKLKEEIPCARIVSTKEVREPSYMNELEYDLVIYPSFKRTLDFLEPLKNADDTAGGYVTGVDVSCYDPDSGYYEDKDQSYENPEDSEKIEELLSGAVRNEFFSEAHVFMNELKENEEGFRLEVFFAQDPSDPEGYQTSDSYILSGGKVPEFLFKDLGVDK